MDSSHWGFSIGVLLIGLSLIIVFFIFGYGFSKLNEVSPLAGRLRGEEMAFYRVSAGR